MRRIGSLTLLFAAMACSWAQSLVPQPLGQLAATASAVVVKLSPGFVNLQPGKAQQFTAAVAGTTNTAVKWSVSPAVGAISSGGLYSAPAALSSPQTVTVTATSVADASGKATASVTIVPPVQVKVSPSTASLAPSGTQQFTATATGATNTAVTWSVNPAVGTISSGGLYSAPAALSSPQTVTVTATSVVNASGKATASLTIVPPVQVTVSPSTASLAPSGTQQFAATVIGLTNTAVTWSVSPAVGTISSGGLYSAPAVLGTPQTVTVRATSVADATKKATASVTVVPPVQVTVSPSTASLARSGTQQFKAAVSGTTNTAVTWSLNPAVGTITSGGLYAAPAAIPSPSSISVIASSAADATRSASAVVVLNPSAPLTITTSTLPGGTAGTTYGASLAVTGGAGPYTWSVESGQLPPGLSLGVSGTISGTPLAAGSYNVTMQVRDVTGLKLSKSFSMAIAAALAITTATLPDGTAQTAYSATLSATGGGAPYSWSVVSGNLPPDVTLASAGNFAGTPSTAGSYGFTVQAQDSVGARATKALGITVVPPAVAVSVSPAAANLSAGQTQQFTAKLVGTKNTGVVWKVNGVVGGAASTGSISSIGLYTAPSAIASSFSVTVTAASQSNPSGTAQSIVTLQAPIAVQVSPGSANLSAGQTQQFTATVTGTTNTALTWSVSPAVGTISSGGLYTAPAALSNPQTVTVTATSAADGSKKATASVTITPPVTVSLTPTTATMHPSQAQAFTATVGGTSNTGVTWSIAPATGTISSSGVYTAPPTIWSTSSVTVTATSAADAAKSASATITLIPAINITTTSLPGGTTGTAYSAAVSATGGVTPYTWSVASGQLPPGISLSTSSGAISGTPTTAGSYNVTMKVTDAAGYQATAVLAIAIAAAACTSCQRLGITTTSLPAGTVGSAYSATLAASGGTSPYTWSISAGQLAPGLTLSTASGVISGTPSITGSYSFTAMVTDSASPQDTASQALAINIALQPVVNVTVSPASANLAAGTTQQFMATVTGSTNTSVTWSLSSPVGTISATGLYAAPASAATPQTVTVTATSVADPSKSASAVVGISPATTAAKSGGLVSYPTPVSSGNMLGNPGFEQGKTGWSDNGFELDTTVSHSGQSSLRLVNANLIPYSQSAAQNLQLKKGLYRIGGWVKLDAMAATTGSGVRFCLYAPVGSGCTGIVKGTADWQYLQFTNIVISQDSVAMFTIQAYGDPDGTAWFDDLSLVRLPFPVQPFMLYPNYRGYLFSDWSQTIQFDVTVTPPDGTLSDYLTKYTVVDETTSSPVASASSASVAETTISISADSWPQGHSFTITFELDLASNGSAVYTYPAYRVLTKSAADRASMAVVVDPNNRILLNGTPTFLIGAYTSGMSSHTTLPAWQTEYTFDFRFSEFAGAGGNMNNPYTIGNVTNSGILPMYQYLQGLSTPVWSTYAMNCFGSTTTTAWEPWWFTAQWPNWPSGEIPARVSAQGFLGFYLADECTPQTVSDAFTWASRTAMVAPDRINIGVQGYPSDALIWRDVLDVFGIDPYYIDGPSWYPLGNTWSDIAEANANLHGARPILGAMQYYQRSGSRWPRQDDLRSVSYMAIVGGANALTYWSLGINGLAYMCTPAWSWCQDQINEYSYLKNVVSELNGLQTVLSSLDDPSRLVANSRADAIKTRIKVSPDGKRYLIAVNVTANTAGARFTWASNIQGNVTVYHESRSIAPDNSTAFTDTFGPYAAHVYVLF